MDDEGAELDEVWKRLRFSDGQIHMLMGFCLALIDTHPDPSELARHFETAVQTTIAKSESALIEEEYLDGELDVSGRLKRALEIALARKGVPRRDPDQG
jgi:hypothetical protein